MAGGSKAKAEGVPNPEQPNTAKAANKRQQDGECRRSRSDFRWLASVRPAALTILLRSCFLGQQKAVGFYLARRFKMHHYGDMPENLRIGSKRLADTILKITHQFNNFDALFRS